MTDKPTYHAGLSEPRLVYAYESSLNDMHDKIKRQDAEIDRLKALVRSLGGDPR